MIFMYYKVIYFCSLNIYLNSHKVKTKMLQCWYFAVAGWQCCYYVACSLLDVTARLFLIHCTNCWKKKDSILFYSILVQQARKLKVVERKNCAATLFRLQVPSKLWWILVLHNIRIHHSFEDTCNLNR